MNYNKLLTIPINSNILIYYKMKKTVLKKIKNQDQFGKDINLLYKNSQTAHKTTIGGFISILYKVCLTVLIFFQGQKMIAKQKNSINSYETSNQLDGSINLNETNMFTFHVLKKQSAGSGPIYLNESISRYIDVSF